ncbi:hypothetical protein CYMTET_33282, partial [Cymbomonas tetramitiformis]
IASSAVGVEQQAEVQGGLGAVKALTEGVGPLMIGTLLSACEGSLMPGAPFLVGAVLILAAGKVSMSLPHLVECTKSLPGNSITAPSMVDDESLADKKCLLSEDSAFDAFEMTERKAQYEEIQ